MLDLMSCPTRALAFLSVVLLVATACGSGAAPATSSSPTAARPSATAAPSATPAGTPAEASIQVMLDAARTADGAPGAMVVVRSGTQRWAAVSGKADLDGTALTSTSRFRIASITKPIVATLVLRAVARGQLKLDAVVADLLPGVVRATPPVTVRQLLNHTSGIFDESNDGDPVVDIAKLTDPTLKAQALDLEKRFTAGEHVIASDRLLVALSELHDRYFAPGAGYHYSNTNYQLLAMILTRVTGASLADLLRTEIVQPLGLARTTIAPPDLTSPEMRGYGTSTTDGSLVDVTDDLLAFGNGGNGGIVSTPDELLTIMQAIASGKLLPADLANDQRTPHQGAYGLGLASYTLTCGQFVGHEGGVNGTASIALASSDGTRGVVIALNARTGADPHLPALADSMLCTR